MTSGILTLGQYFVTFKLDFPLFDHNWTAKEELLMFEGLEKFGFGNWRDISKHMGMSKSHKEIKRHFNSCYLNQPNRMPDQLNILTKKVGMK